MEFEVEAEQEIAFNTESVFDVEVCSKDGVEVLANNRATARFTELIKVTSLAQLVPSPVMVFYLVRDCLPILHLSEAHLSTSPCLDREKEED